MRVSLAARTPSPPGDEPAPEPMLDPSGAATVLGAELGEDGLAVPVVAREDTLFGPRAACLASEAGPLFVSDTGHHRVLVWRRRPREDRTPADFVLGQPSMRAEGRNAKGEVGGATLNVPTGIAAVAGVLAIADAWNHRVLLWLDAPARANQPADVVLGQADLRGSLANRGGDAPAADTLHWCYGVALLDGRLFVCDTGNRRVLVWDAIPTRHGTKADRVLGQRDFVTRDENAGESAGPSGMRWPHGIARYEGALLVADAGNNRVMGWHTLPARNGAPCDFVLGQTDPSAVDHNRTAYRPTAISMNMPYALAVQRRRLVVADTANSRLLGFSGDGEALHTGAPARYLAGQFGFADKGDNRWQPAMRDSLCWPYGVAAMGDTLVVADAGNNRVLLWEAFP